MLVLALDTSTPACSVGLVELSPLGPRVAPAPPGEPAWDQVVSAAGTFAVDARRHGELLAPLIQQVLDARGAAPGDLGGVVVGLGPGPFTSLRVGIVTGATFAAALGVPCHGVCSLDGLGAVTAGSAAVVTDARRREVFWAAYRDGRRIAGPAVDYPVKAADLLLSQGVGSVTGPGVALYPDAFAAFNPAETEERHASRAPLPPGYPSPFVLAALAASDLLAGRPPAPLTPIYLRRPDVAEPHPPKEVGG